MHENQILDIGLKIFKERNKHHCRSYLYQKIREECCHNKTMLLCLLFSISMQFYKYKYMKDFLKVRHTTLSKS